MVNCEDDAKNLTDPDIMGFGVSLYLSRVSMIALAGEEEIESLLEPKFGQILPLILLIVFIINVFDAKEIEYTRVASTIEIPENPENSMESDVALNAATSSTTEEAIPMSETIRASAKAMETPKEGRPNGQVSDWKSNSTAAYGQLRRG
ncbi:hypothetical protein CSPX01_06290 [Colletotrichum filicis]|nr:hypothetical protein CSPX01_06290 [Colletotrichum filicis]